MCACLALNCLSACLLSRVHNVCVCLCVCVCVFMCVCHVGVCVPVLLIRPVLLCLCRTLLPPPTNPPPHHPDYCFQHANPPDLWGTFVFHVAQIELAGTLCLRLVCASEAECVCVCVVCLPVSYSRFYSFLCRPVGLAARAELSTCGYFEMFVLKLNQNGFSCQFYWMNLIWGSRNGHFCSQTDLEVTF